MQRKRGAWAVRLALATIAVGLAVIAFRSSGSFLVVDNHEKSDAIVITQGDSLDAAYWTGLRLLADGYGGELFLDARKDRIFFGHSQAEAAAEFIGKTATGFPGRVKVCPILADTTAQEVYEVAGCLKERPIRSVLLVVDDFHCRRSLSMFSRLLPQYRWSIAPVLDAKNFGPEWWRKREWVRTAMVEWQHILWWEIVDRWRYAPLVSRAQKTTPTPRS